jgi:hypothetical protein
VSTFTEKKVIPVTTPTHPKVNYAKKKIISHKMKTEFKEMEDYSQLGEDEIKENDARKSALELRFKELKQESLNVILTDTLSILKIAPNEKEKEKTVFPSRQHKSIKNISIKQKREYLATEPNIKFCVKE